MPSPPLAAAAAAAGAVAAAAAVVGAVLTAAFPLRPDDATTAKCYRQVGGFRHEFSAFLEVLAFLEMCDVCMCTSAPLCWIGSGSDQVQVVNITAKLGGFDAQLEAFISCMRVMHSRLKMEDSMEASSAAATRFHGGGGC